VVTKQEPVTIVADAAKAPGIKKAKK
jgi:hypothetical protein